MIYFFKYFTCFLVCLCSPGTFECQLRIFIGIFFSAFFLSCFLFVVCCRWNLKRFFFPFRHVFTLSAFVAVPSLSISLSLCLPWIDIDEITCEGTWVFNFVCQRLLILRPKKCNFEDLKKFLLPSPQSRKVKKLNLFAFMFALPLGSSVNSFLCRSNVASFQFMRFSIISLKSLSSVGRAPNGAKSPKNNKTKNLRLQFFHSRAHLSI